MSFVNTKTIILLIFIVILLVVIKNIIGSILSLRQNSHIVTTIQQQEKNEKQKKEFLKQQLYYVNTNEFIENEAREKLGMAKEGEFIILEPPSPPPVQPVVIENTPNWKKWWEKFL